MNIGQGLTDAWRQVATFVPRLVAFLVILIIGWIVAKALQKLVDKILDRVGFERAVQRSGVQRWLESSRYDASGLLAKLVYYAILLITLQIAFSVFGPNPISALLNGVVGWLPKAVVAIVIIVIAGAIARAVRDLVDGALGGLSYGRWLGIAAAVFIWALGIIAALNQIGVATTVTTPVLITVLATIGAIIAIGLGGGLVRPMQQRWERWIGRIEAEAPQARAHAEAYQRGREDARSMARPAEPARTTPGAPGTPGTTGPTGPTMGPTGGTTGGATRADLPPES
ncbi:mechanosensitive ion channel family protein [Nonomuraea sp. NPDC004702]